MWVRIPPSAPNIGNWSSAWKGHIGYGGIGRHLCWNWQTGRATGMTAQTRKYRSQRKRAVKMLGGQCVDCPSKARLEFDHVKASEKSYDIGTRFGRVKFETLLPELKKCVLRCRTCHAKKTKACGEYPPAIKPTTHGDLAMYSRYKCRCEKCRIKYSEWRRENRRRKPRKSEACVRLPYGTPAAHGEMRSYYRGCRCNECRAANARREKDRRHARMM